MAVKQQKVGRWKVWKSLRISEMERFFSIKKDQTCISVDSKIRKSTEKINRFETCSFLPEFIGSGSMRKIELKRGMTIYLEDLNPRENFLSSLTSEHFPIKFLFTVHGEVRSEGKNGMVRNISCEIQKSGQSSLTFTTLPVKGSMEKTANQRATLVIILVEPEVFSEIIAEDMDQIPRDLQRLIDMKSESVYHRTSGQTSAVSSALRQMLTCPYKGLTRRLFLESKALELMACQMEYLTRHEGNRVPKKPRLKLKSRDIEKIYQARDILNREMENPPSLFDLAKEVGLTHTRLNQGFHEIFETTVFGYLRSIRLETARSLLEAGEMNVTEAAFTVGYSSLSHFARAFNQFTGVNPGVYLKKTY